MSTVPEGHDDQPDRDADAMRAQLRKDVESWSKARNETSPREAAESSVPAVKPASSKPATRAKTPKRAPPAAAPADAKSKPFSMSVRWQHDRGVHPVHDRPGRQVNWVTFEAAGGGLVAVQLQHIVAIYNEQGVVKLATTAAGVHVLKDTTVQRAVMVVSAAADAEAVRSE